MGYFQSAMKHNGMILASAIMILGLMMGCATHNTENMSAQETGVQAPPAVSGRQVTRVWMSRNSDQGLTVGIEGSEKLEYTSIKQAFPFAISVYLPDAKIHAGVEPEIIEDQDISGLRLGYADQDETTAKLEILLTRDLAYSVREGENDLTIQLKTGAEDTVAAPSEAVMPSSVTTESIQEGSSDPVLASGEAAELTHIVFDTDDKGQSDIRVTTSHPVRYEARSISADRMDLILFNTRTPVVHQRPLLTTYFNSAVERIEPKADGKDTRIEISIREQVPYQLLQNSQGIYMGFEPSSVQPPSFDKAKVALNQQAQMAGTAAPAAVAPAVTQVAASNGMPVMAGTRDTITETLTGTPTTYTGEKIKLDFYDTDIKNVFRILRSVSGLNFAIDKDVQGKVTMSLEEPVPWDQVLDLVLKMNGLGKKMEGNVVRIATLATMADEERALQDAITAKKKSMEQKESLAPLVTEYIPINYSDAKADIEPHVSQILTPERGTVSVDQRTNMIIITDTQTKIDQAHDLIYRLDTVTPQIMIEARVVEVTKEFSRKLGLEWSFTNASSVSSGFVDDFSLAVNGTTGISGDFSFFRFFGSSMAALNAKLEASEAQGDVRIVSSPRILTLDNKKAKIKQGQEVAYLERDDSGGSSVKFKEVDLLLEVTPHVTPDKRISLNVLLTKNDVSSVTATGVPTIATNEAETELLVNNNDTVVIGGVVKTTNSEADSGVPFLTGIPILGQLFGTKQITDDRNELLIFLTPSIVQLEQKRHMGRGIN